MKLATFSVADRSSWGVVLGDDIADVGQILSKRFASLREVITAQAYAQITDAVQSAPRIPIADIKWLPVIANPAKILCIGLNYATHVKETGRTATEHPPVFTRFADSQMGHLEPIVRPHVSTHLDYEGELAIVIGKGGRYIKPAVAMDHVAGYACYNDVSVRDWQQHTIQFTPGKNFPATGAFGPTLITADEINDYRTLHLETRLNGTVVQSAGLDQLIFDIPALIAYCSAFTPLAPGDVIVTGTPGGVGFKREPPLYMKPGDRVEVEITKVGLLINSVIEES